MAGKPKRKPNAKSRKAGATAGHRRIVDAALAMAEKEGWDNVGLSRLAAGLGIGAAGLRRRFRDKDAIADAWFRRAELAMLADLPGDFHLLPAPARLEILYGRWFDALAPHRRVTADMLKAKLWLFHPHHAVPLAFNLSRLIQWLRDRAGLDAGGRRKQVEEIALTGLLLAGLAVWCRDDTAGQARTKEFLRRRLARADMWAARFYGRGGGD